MINVHELAEHLPSGMSNFNPTIWHSSPSPMPSVRSWSGLLNT